MNIVRKDNDEGAFIRICISTSRWLSAIRVSSEPRGELHIRCYTPKRPKGGERSAERFRFSVWDYKAFPREHWKRIRTTNGLERINKELKREIKSCRRIPER